MSKTQQLSGHQPRPAKKTPSGLYLQFALAMMLIVAGVVMLLWLGLASDQSRANGSNPAGLQPGQAAPDFSLPSLNGETMRLSDLAGQVVVVNLWATWCPPCKAEMPTLNAYYEAHRQDGLVVLAVNNQEDAATVKAFIQAQGFSFPVLLDEQAQVSALYQVRGFPTSFIIDRNGSIQHIQVGEINAQQLEETVGPLLQ